MPGVIKSFSHIITSRGYERDHKSSVPEEVFYDDLKIKMSILIQISELQERLSKERSENSSAKTQLLEAQDRIQQFKVLNTFSRN